MPLLSAACASRGAAAPPPAGDGITAAEIEKIPAASAFDVIQRLRPEFLRSRARIPGGTAESGAPLVYVDGIRAGGLDVLRTIAARDVHEIRRLSAPDATTRYGPGHSSGVIEITMRD